MLRFEMRKKKQKSDNGHQADDRCKSTETHDRFKYQSTIDLSECHQLQNSSIDAIESHQSRSNEFIKCHQTITTDSVERSTAVANELTNEATQSEKVASNEAIQYDKTYFTESVECYQSSSDKKLNTTNNNILI